MKFEYVKLEEDRPEWKELEEKLVDCPVGHAVYVPEITGQKLGGWCRAINNNSKLIRVESFHQGGKFCVKVVKRLVHTAPPPEAPVEAATPAAPAAQPAAATTAGHKPVVFVVDTLGAFYIDELSVLANQHGAVRVPKRLFRSRDRGAMKYAMSELRKRGHMIDGRKQRKYTSILIPRAGSKPFVARPDLKGKLFGKAFDRLDALTRPDSQALPAPKDAAEPIVIVGMTPHHQPKKKIMTSINLTEPTKFPTGNKCFVCVGSSQQSVCGDKSETTYKGVKICRVHLGMLNKGVRLFARPTLTRSAMVLTK